MAALDQTVAIIFNGVDNTGTMLSDIGGKIESFASGAQAVVTPLASLGDAVVKANLAIVGLGVTLVGVAINEAGKFQASINEIGTLFGGTTAQINAFGQNVLDYSTNSVKSIEDITGSIYAAVSAGVDYKSSIEFMTVAEKLSVAGRADLNSTTVALASTLNAYGESTDKAAEYSDVFFQTVKLGQTTLPELSASLAQVTGIASAAGIPFSDLSAAVAALTAYGLPTSQAMSGIKAAISNIIDPSASAKEAADKLGISFDSNALKSKGLAGVLNDVYTATDGNVGKMTSLFGSIEGLNVALTLGGDKAGKFKLDLDSMTTAGGSTAAAFNTMSTNADLMAQKFKNAVDATLITAGTPFLDEWAGILSAVGDLFKGLTISFKAGTFDSIFTALETVLADVGAYLGKMAKALPAAFAAVDFSGVVTALGGLSGAFGSIFDGLDLTEPDGLAKAIQFVVDSIDSLLTVGAGIVTQWGEWSGEIIALIQNFNDLSGEEKKGAGEALGLAQQLNLLFSAAGQVGSGIEALGTAFEAIASVQMAKFLTGATTASGALTAIQTAAGGASLLMTGGLVVAAGAAGYAIGTVLNEGLDAVIENMGGGKAGLGGLIYDLTHDTEKLSSATTTAGASTSGMADKLKDNAIQATQLHASFSNLGEQTAYLTELFGKGGSATEKMGVEKFTAAGKADFLTTASNALAVATGKVKEETELVSDGMGGFTLQAGKSAQAMTDSAQAYLTAAAASGTLDEAHKAVKLAYDQLYEAGNKSATSTTDYKTAISEAGAASKGSAKDLLDLAKVASDYEIKMEQIASNEAIKVIESKIKLDIAEVESNAKIAVALIDSIAKTYDSDVNLIGELMGQVGDGWSKGDKIKIAMATEANARVAELHEGQMKLIGAQVDYMQAKTAAASNGSPLVSIQADGLKPHLEAFMWEILGAIQVKMAYDGGDMLTGGCSL